MLVFEPIPMDRAQIRHLEDARELWTRFASISALQEKFRGARGWKKVGNAEYLTSYFMDPAIGRKVMNSHGRRSPDTEQEKDEFDRCRAEVDTAMAALKQDLDPLMRVGRALRLGRMDSLVGDVLRELSRYELLGTDLMVVGSTCLHLYEASAGALLSRSLMAERDLDLMSSTAGREETMEKLLPIVRRADKTFVMHSPSRSIRNADGFRLHLHTRRSIIRSIDRMDDASEDQISVLHALIGLDPVSAVAIARDGTPVGITGMDPRAFALTKHALACLDPDRDGPAVRTAKDQAYAVGRLLVRFGSRPFEDDQLSAFPAFAESIETGDPEIADTIEKVLRP